MAKNDNAHSVRLCQSIRRCAGNDEANDFESQYPLSKAADIQKKYEWAKNACQYLENRFPSETVIEIRKECRCNDGKSIASKISKYLKRADSTKQFVNLFNAHETFASMEYISDRKILFCYPECYCACIKRAPEAISKTWCYCTLGNAEGIFREVFKKDDIRVSLVKTIKTGADQCVIEVEW